MPPKIYSGPAYKFISPENFKLVLENESLWYTRGDCFNDPYEANPYMVPIDWNALVKEDKSNVETVRTLANVIFIRICSKIYITCFSQRSDSQLMWSHYANSHKGLCFEIVLPELTQENYKPGHPVPIPVTYCKSLYEEREKRDQNSEDLPLYLATFKSDDWAYEQEVRMILHPESANKEIFNLVNDGKNASVNFNIESITKVVFGSRMNSNDEQDIIKLFCEKGHLPDFYKMDLNPNTLQFFEEKLSVKEEILTFNKKPIDSLNKVDKQQIELKS